jgi:hypothetical protein
VREYRLLSPARAPESRIAQAPADTSRKPARASADSSRRSDAAAANGYLRNGLMQRAELIESWRQKRILSPEQAYDSLFSAIRDLP